MQADLRQCFCVCSVELDVLWVSRCAPRADILYVKFSHRPLLIYLQPAVRTNTAVFHHSDQPPVGITVVEQDHGVAFGGVRLSFHSGYESVESVHEFEVNVFYVWSACIFPSDK
jgi:hypothetical protein